MQEKRSKQLHNSKKDRNRTQCVLLLKMIGRVCQIGPINYGFSKPPCAWWKQQFQDRVPGALKIKQAPFSKLGEVVEELNEGKGQHQAALIKPGEKLDLFLMSS